ncbi:flagellar hook-associated protein FlgL [Bacillus solimangrovi]|uniref:Flagellar hook-associated protein 3 n=1 Tax=Bacillus solimangrovi TaxID=1305675 RepID=A0A1E5LDR8_9BACI|nr:flagellar hook-associated protein FlgL [Bacillus solimangrovi]OEH92200.1 hypothetical protein BFG57_02710 [Bacillus solimangrovi]
MRVTQSMLTNSNLTYISNNYERLGKVQDQLNTGKKITKPSDDPVVAMKGMRYRSEVVEIEQFQRNLTEGYSWMDNADQALGEAGDILNRVRELVTQAANDSYTEEDRANIAKEINQLKQHLADIADTKVGNKYIFNGTNTSESPINEAFMDIEYGEFATDLDLGNGNQYVMTYQGKPYSFKEVSGTEFTFEAPDSQRITIDRASDEIVHTFEELPNGSSTPFEVNESISSDQLVFTSQDAVSRNTQDVEIEVMKGVTIPINVRAQEAFSQEMFGLMTSIEKMLVNTTTEASDLDESLDQIDDVLNGVVNTRAELGARQNRIEMVEARLSTQEIVAKKTVSENEDIDFEKAIMDLQTQESLHRVALAAGARIIQPTLMDFLR